MVPSILLRTSSATAGTTTTPHSSGASGGTVTARRGRAELLTSSSSSFGREATSTSTTTPVLYDTSVSSGTEGSRNHPSNSLSSSSTHPHHRQHLYRTTITKNSTTAAGAGGVDRPSMMAATLGGGGGRYPTKHVVATTTQSEPGGAAVVLAPSSSYSGADRFAAYLSRFAADERTPAVIPHSQHVETTTTVPESRSLTAKALAAASRSSSSSSATTTRRQAQSEIILTTTANSNSSNIRPVSTATGRTRDLALRLERRQTAVQQQRRQQHQQFTPASPSEEPPQLQRTTKPQGQQQQLQQQPFKVEPLRKKNLLDQYNNNDNNTENPATDAAATTSHANSTIRNNNLQHIPKVPSAEAIQSTQQQHRSSRSRNPQPNHTVLDSRSAERPRSLPPPQRRHRSLFPPLPDAPGSRCGNDNDDDDDDHPNNSIVMNTSIIVAHGPRAEIETTQPARVRELRRKLWTEDESLRPVGVSSSSYYYYDCQNGEDRRLRNSRSLSPKTHRVAHTTTTTSRLYDHLFQEGEEVQIRDNNSATAASRFKSRYYDAAQRGIHASSTTEPGGAERESWQQRQERNEHSEALAGLASSGGGGATGTAPTTATKQNTVHSLLSKLSQVNRDDPQAALAQIDAILNQESESLSASGGGAAPMSSGGVSAADSTIPSIPMGKPVNPWNSDDADKDDGDDDNDDDERSSSDETSVSSITNPTYASLRPKAEVTDSNLFAGTSGGQARPSKLLQYNTKKNSVVSSAKPTTSATSPTDSSARLALKNESALPNSSRSVPSDVIHSSGKSPSSSGAAAISNTIPLASLSAHRNIAWDAEADRLAESTLFQKIGTYMMAPKLSATSSYTNEPKKLSHAAEIEEKIKRWDDMSTGIIEEHKPGKNTSFEDLRSTSTAALGSILSEPELEQPQNVLDGALSRAHPWDAAIPVRMGKISTLETSMELGDGVETHFVAKYPNAMLSPDRSGIAPVRRMRKDRLGRERDQQGIDEATRISATPAKSIRTNEDGRSSGDTAEALKDNSRQGEKLPKGRPSRYNEETVPTQQQRAVNNLADEFDSAWVKLPPSTFFKTGTSGGGRASQPQSWNGSRERDGLEERQQQQQHYSHPVAVPESTGDRGKFHISDASDAEVEVEYMPHRRSEVERFSSIGKELKEQELTVNADCAQLGIVRHNGVQGMDDGLQTNPSENNEADALNINAKKAKRGLRSFLKRKQKQTAANVQSVQSSVADYATYASNDSRRFRESRLPLENNIDRSETEVNGNENEKLPSFQEKRRSARSRSPSKVRSKSLDERRIRNPNIARKFNRLLRVYDEDVP